MGSPASQKRHGISAAWLTPTRGPASIRTRLGGALIAYGRAQPQFAGRVEEILPVLGTVDRQRLAQAGRAAGQVAGRAGRIEAAATAGQVLADDDAAGPQQYPGGATPGGEQTTLAQKCMP